MSSETRCQVGAPCCRSGQDRLEQLFLHVCAAPFGCTQARGEDELQGVRMHELVGVALPPSSLSRSINLSVSLFNPDERETCSTADHPANAARSRGKSTD